MRRLVIVSVVGLWVVMMGTLVRRWVLEVRPERTPGTWQSVLTRARSHYQWRKGIYLPTAKGLERVGFTQTVFYHRADGKYTIQNETRVTVAVPNLLPTPTAFDLHATALVGGDFTLERLTMRLDSEVARAICDGHVEDGKLVLRAEINGMAQEPFEIALPEGQVASQGFSPVLALPALKVGMKWSVVIVDPFTFRPSAVEIEVLRREPIRWEGNEVDTYRLVIRSGILSALAWVTPDGEVLREQTLFGLTFIKERLPDEDAEEPKKGERERKTG